MTAGLLDFTIEIGTTFKKTLVWKDKDKVPFDITGYTAQMQLRLKLDDGSFLLELTDGNGITIGGTTGEITITIDATTTAAITWQRAVYDLLLTDTGGEVKKLVEGTFCVKKCVTR